MYLNIFCGDSHQKKSIRATIERKAGLDNLQRSKISLWVTLQEELNTVRLQLI